MVRLRLNRILDTHHRRHINSLLVRGSIRIFMYILIILNSETADLYLATGRRRSKHLAHVHCKKKYVH
jgi:hypothetical protein